MKFREDINGLRAIAVIAVVLFHFNPSWMPGGFAGVDVFFVISGFLMTGIIFKGIEQENFSILKFYVARANRIIPALALLCFTLIIFGWFFLSPIDYKQLAKHAASSMSFFSNVTYWRESGYFEASSHEKWLLHTWSLSVEWQFYIIYPIVLVIMSKFLSIRNMKKLILLGTVLGFIFCIIATYKWPNPSYFLLPTRAWEMMLGGIAYLYPLSLKDKQKKFTGWVGIIFIFTSYTFISEDTPWPGYFAFFPTLGSFLIIQAQTSSFITHNKLFQKLGAWSYSIYLWHWPLVVAIYQFSLSEYYIYIGIVFSVLLGFLSNKYIEKIKFRNNYSNFKSYLKCKPLHILIITVLASLFIFINNGFFNQSPELYQSLVKSASPSPFREKCHINKYQDPALSCEYFGEDVSWAVFGDSHSTEIAYALAEKLKSENKGVKHFTFSGCKPSYQEKETFSRCSKWYNDSVEYIVNNKDIDNIVFNHRFTSMLVKGDASNYPHSSLTKITNETINFSKNIDKLIIYLAANKKNVYIFDPIPELDKDINHKIFHKLNENPNLFSILGTSLDWYEKRNKYVIEHFKNAKYPSNVHLIKTKNALCDEVNCFAVKDRKSLYFDDNHLSIHGAKLLVELVKH